MRQRIWICGLIICNLTLSPMNSIAQDLKSTDLDFWIGKWNATWEGGHAINTISKVLDEKVIHEEFIQDKGSSPLLHGRSWSVFNPVTNSWAQTWVDNQGAYLDFKGDYVNGNFVFSRTFENKGKTISQRMVFHDIKADSFSWDWESSADGGQTWNNLWKINYTKAK